MEQIEILGSKPLKENKGLEKKEGKIVEESVITKEELRKRLPTIEKMYDFCTEELGYYMPRYESWVKKAKCISENYLWGVIIGNYWSIKSANIKYPKKLKKTITKRELVEVLENEIEGKNTGFDEDHYPDRL